MKRFATMLLALAMILSLTIAASAASITITPPPLPEGAEENGITYTAYKIFDANIDGEKVAYTIDASSPYFATIQAATDYFTLTQINGTSTYVVTAKEDYTAEVANTFAETLKAVAADPAGTAKKVDGKYVIDGLTDGYYLVTSSVGSDLILDTIGDITVATKNDYPSLDKKVEGKDDYTTADMGEVLSFTIDVVIPADAVGEIVVHDTMTGLEYVGMTAVEGITQVVDITDGCAVHFVLTADYVAANRDTTITIAYTAKVTADVANNETWLVDDTYTSTPDNTKVYSTDIVIDKYDAASNETKLEGARFVLKNSDGKFYSRDEYGNVTWVDDQADATVMITDAKGAAEFTDIADGTYYLVEITAPAGYNLLTEPVKVEVKAVLENETTVVDIVAAIENKTGSELPETGGMGTTMFSLFGGILVLASVVLLVTKKRMQNAE